MPNVPTCFDERTRLEIQADPANVDLRSRSPYFYEFGCKMAPMTIGILLFFAFKSRYKEVLTKAHNTASHVAAPKILAGLTKEEESIWYEAAQSTKTTSRSGVSVGRGSSVLQEEDCLKIPNVIQVLSIVIRRSNC